MCFPRSSVINEISLALWALVCGGLWAAAAAIAPLKEESSPKQSKRDWINEAEDKRVELSWRSGASQIKNEINLLMEWLIGVACSAPEAKWSPTQAAKSCAASQRKRPNEPRPWSERIGWFLWGPLWILFVVGYRRLAAIMLRKGKTSWPLLQFLFFFSFLIFIQFFNSLFFSSCSFLS